MKRRNDDATANDRVTVYLAIESVDSLPSSIAAHFATYPDREWVIGDPRGKMGKRWENNGWVWETTIRSEENEGRLAPELIPLALNEFESKVRPLVKAARLLDESAEKYVVLAILAAEVPGVELSHSFLQLLADLGGTFQVDLN